MQMRTPRWTGTGALQFLSRLLALSGLVAIFVAAGQIVLAAPLQAGAGVGKSGLQVPRFVSLKTGRVNVRVGPGEDYKIAWVFTRTGLPIFGHLGGRNHIVYGVGFSGNGVAPCVVGGRILASLALGSADEWSASPLVDGTQGRFPPEPVRFLGAHVVREGVARKEEAETLGRTPSRIAVALAKLAPAGMIPKKDE